jgi:hypothetical protein
MIYSQKSNCAALFPISIFIHLWAIYIFLGSLYIFCCSQIGRPIVGVYKSLTDIWNECRNWDWGRALSFLGKFFPDFWYSIFAVYSYTVLTHPLSISPSWNLKYCTSCVYDRCIWTFHPCARNTTIFFHRPFPIVRLWLFLFTCFFVRLVF